MNKTIWIEGEKITISYRPPFEEEREMAEMNIDEYRLARAELSKIEDETAKKASGRAIERAFRQKMLDFLFGTIITQIEGQLPKDVMWIDKYLEDNTPRHERHAIELILRRAYYLEVIEIATEFFGTRKLAVNPDDPEFLEKYMPMFIEALAKSGTLGKLAEKN